MTTVIAQGVGESDVGSKHSENEDSYCVDNHRQLYVVSDGMGGHAAGKRASKMAISEILRTVARSSDILQTPQGDSELVGAATQVMVEAVQNASRVIHSAARNNAELAGMGCTVTAVLVVGHHGIMAHVGDSRLYLVRDSAAHQLSNDHTLAAELVRQGMIEAQMLGSHPFAHVLSRSCGTHESVQVETLAFELLGGDRLLLCSDGLSRYLTDHSEIGYLVDRDSVDIVAGDLIQRAKDGGGADNVTAVVVSIDDDGSDSERAAVRARRSRLKLDALRKVSLLEDLSMPQLFRVLQVSEIQAVEAGSTLVRQGQELASLFVVLGGRLGRSGGSSELRELGPYDSAGLRSLAHPYRTDFELTAARDATVLRLDYVAFQKLCSTRPWLGVALLRKLSEELAERGAAAVD
jgi:serine/threonine protein phosphatase PrpC